MTAITRPDIDSATFDYAAHYNMGYVQDDDKTTMRHKGFGYGYRCVEYPRLSMIDRSSTLDDGGMMREWYVDGVKLDNIEAAIAALNVPVTLTDEDRATLELIPADFEDSDTVRERIAGCPRPDGAIMPGTPHSIAIRKIDALRDKGLVQSGKRQWGPGEGHDLVPLHLRYDTTIRRTPQKE